MLGKLGGGCGDARGNRGVGNGENGLRLACGVRIGACCDERLDGVLMAGGSGDEEGG